MPTDKRWIAFYVLCMGVLMDVLDTTIVNVALPSIRDDLGFSDTALAWVINAYMLTFGGFLLLGGRLGDLYGPRRVFLAGLALFVLASLGCGLANSQTMLVAARAIQGVGGAVLSAVSLSLMINLFPEPRERAKAMGLFGFVAAGGGSLGAVLGGVITDTLDWHWNFLVNVPIGIGVFLASLYLIDPDPHKERTERIDAAGAVAVTAGMMFLVYAIVNGNAKGWTSTQTVGTLTIAGCLLAIFLLLEGILRVPLVPLRLFTIRSLSVASIVGVLWAAAMFAWFFLSALYMQLVLGYTPLKVGLAFLPANVVMAVFSVGLSARIVDRFGLRAPISTGLTLAGAGLAWFARAPLDGGFLIDVLPGMMLLGVGAGMALNPVILAAMRDVKSDESGLASGIVNTSFMMGGALGLAILASVAAATTTNSGAADEAAPSALLEGYHAAFVVGAIFAFAAAALALALGRGSVAPGTDPHGVPVPLDD